MNILMLLINILNRNIKHIIMLYKFHILSGFGPRERTSKKRLVEIIIKLLDH